jgi:hypothetical protein
LKKIEEERQRIARDLHDSVSHELLELKNVADGKQVETKPFSEHVYKRVLTRDNVKLIKICYNFKHKFLSLSFLKTTSLISILILSK